MAAFLWIPRRLVQPQQWLCGGGMWVYGAIIWVCEGMHPCVLMWKPEQDSWCLSPLLSALLPWESVCYWTRNFSAQLAHSEILGSTYVYPHNAGVAGTQGPAWIFTWRFELRSLYWWQKISYRAISAAPSHSSLMTVVSKPGHVLLRGFLWKRFFFHCLLDNLQGLLYFLYTKSYLRCILQFTVKLFWSF